MGYYVLYWELDIADSLVATPLYKVSKSPSVHVNPSCFAINFEIADFSWIPKTKHPLFLLYISSVYFTLFQYNGLNCALPLCLSSEN